jgi:hypothetical protein
MSVAGAVGVVRREIGKTKKLLNLQMARLLVLVSLNPCGFQDRLQPRQIEGLEEFSKPHATAKLPPGWGSFSLTWKSRRLAQTFWFCLSYDTAHHSGQKVKLLRRLSP